MSEYVIMQGVGPLMDVEYARQGAESAVPCSTQVRSIYNCHEVAYVRTS